MHVKSIVEDGLNIFAIVEHGKQRQRYRLSRRTGAVSAFTTDSSDKPCWAKPTAAVAQKVRRAILAQGVTAPLDQSSASPKQSRRIRPKSRTMAGAAAISLTPEWMGSIPGQLRVLATPSDPTPLLMRLNLMQLLRAETF